VGGAPTLQKSQKLAFPQAMPKQKKEFAFPQAMPEQKKKLAFPQAMPEQKKFFCSGIACGKASF
jgi:hypothetical protein